MATQKRANAIHPLFQNPSLSLFVGICTMYHVFYQCVQIISTSISDTVNNNSYLNGVWHFCARLGYFTEITGVRATVIPWATSTYASLI